MYFVGIGGSVVECSPATRAARVRFPADAMIFWFTLANDLYKFVVAVVPESDISAIYSGAGYFLFVKQNATLQVENPYTH